MIKKIASSILAVLPSSLLFGDVFVSSFSDGLVRRYDETTGASLGVFVAAGSGGLDLPHRGRFGSDGAFYVASGGNDSVHRYNGSTGAFIDVFIVNGGGGTGSDRLDYPVDLIFRGDVLLVTSQINDSVKRYNASTGAFIDSFVPSGSGGLDGPSGMVFGPDENLYVVGRYSNLVHRYNGTTGAPMGSFGSGQLTQPFGIALGSNGSLYVASGDTNTVAEFDPVTGNFLGNLSTGGSGLGLPVGVESGPDGDIHVASFGTNHIKRFDVTTGAFLENFIASSMGADLNGPNYFTFADLVAPSEAPAVSNQPLAGSIIAGGGVSFSAGFSGSPAPSIQWQSSADGGATWADISNGANINGAQSATINFSSTSQLLDGILVRAVGTNASGQVTTQPAALTVDPGNARLAAVSARAFVGTGDQVVIPGASITGTGTRRLLIRAAGPALGALGVEGALADPVISVQLLNGTVLGANDDWSAGSPDETTFLEDAMASVGAFEFEQGSADAALILEIGAGAVTFVVSGAAGTTGVALIEVYELP